MAVISAARRFACRNAAADAARPVDGASQFERFGHRSKRRIRPRLHDLQCKLVLADDQVGQERPPPPTAPSMARPAWDPASAASPGPSSAKRSSSRSSAAGSAGSGHSDIFASSAAKMSAIVETRQRWGAAWRPRPGRRGWCLLAGAVWVWRCSPSCAGALAWRLSQGPLDVAWLARLIESHVKSNSPTRLHIGEASIAWAGYQTGADQGLQIRFRMSG